MHLSDWDCISALLPDIGKYRLIHFHIGCNPLLITLPQLLHREESALHRGLLMILDLESVPYPAPIHAGASNDLFLHQFAKRNCRTYCKHRPNRHRRLHR